MFAKKFFSYVELYKRNSILGKQWGVLGFPFGLYFYSIFVIGWDNWIKKRDSYLSCIKGMGGLIDIYCITPNAMLFFFYIYVKSLLIVYKVLSYYFINGSAKKVIEFQNLILYIKIWLKDIFDFREF